MKIVTSLVRGPVCEALVSKSEIIIIIIIRQLQGNVTSSHVLFTLLYCKCFAALKPVSLMLMWIFKGFEPVPFTFVCKFWSVNA